MFLLLQSSILDLFGLDSELDVTLGPGLRRLEIVHDDVHREKKKVDVVRLRGRDLEQIHIRVPSGIIFRSCITYCYYTLAS